MSKYHLYVGIDPGSNTGVALWYPATKELELHQFKSHCEAMLFLHDKLKTCLIKASIKFRIEDARLTMAGAKKMPPHLLKQQHPGKIQGVGYVKAYSKDWEAFCNLQGYAYELLPPNNTKTSPSYFEALTCIKTLKTQDHMRDSGMLVFGR